MKIKNLCKIFKNNSLSLFLKTKSHFYFTNNFYLLKTKLNFIDKNDLSKMNENITYTYYRIPEGIKERKDENLFSMIQKLKNKMTAMNEVNLTNVNIHQFFKMHSVINNDLYFITKFKNLYLYSKDENNEKNIKDRVITQLNDQKLYYTNAFKIAIDIKPLAKLPKNLFKNTNLKFLYSGNPYENEKIFLIIYNLDTTLITLCKNLY